MAMNLIRYAKVRIPAMKTGRNMAASTVRKPFLHGRMRRLIFVNIGKPVIADDSFKFKPSIILLHIKIPI